MPRFIYISKTDEENSDYNQTFEALRERFGGNEVKMLAGYNAGPNNVKKWQEEWGEGHEPTAADIPFPETEQYVKKVCNAKLLYAWLYHLDEAGA